MPAGERRFFREVDLTGVSVGAWRLRSGGWGISENLKNVLLARVSTVFSIQNDRILRPEKVWPRGQLNHLAKRSARRANSLAHGTNRLSGDLIHQAKRPDSVFANAAIYMTHSASAVSCPIYTLHYEESADLRLGNLEHHVPDEPLRFEVQQLLMVNHSQYDSRCILYALNRALNVVSHVVRKRGQRTKPLQLVGLKRWRAQPYCIHMRRQYVVLFLILTVEVRDA
ncbi:hypothetical protein [Halodesulfovibrio sp.]|uniref:hypothetical protein n=1 Tax=Halodesulfovibrio sp. TaxID=1912772 RepID=UPI0025C4309D|nr:hypothetical protein [Halodesulfovibrio sp.]